MDPGWRTHVAKTKSGSKEKGGSSARTNRTMNGGLNPATGMVKVEGGDDAEENERLKAALGMAPESSVSLRMTRARGPT